MFPGETILSGAPSTCPDCGKTPEFQVCSSATGYYIGTMCKCGPYSRESSYFPTFKDAEKALKDNSWKPRSSEYNREKAKEFRVEVLENPNVDELLKFLQGN